MEAFLARTSDTEVSNSSNLVWKRDGLAILRDDDEYDDDYDGEEIEPPLSDQPPPPAAEDLMAVIRRKRRLLEDRASEDKVSAKSHSGPKSWSKGDVSAGSALIVGDERGAAATLLENYMKLHAPKRLKTKRRSFFKSLAENPTGPSNTSCEGPPSIIAPARIVPDMPCPQIVIPETPLRFIVAVSLPRGVLRRLDNLLPHAELFDRDYNSHNSSTWRPSSVCRSEVVSALADEADLIVSPSTGIILTTIVKLRQKPLPGTKGNSAIYSRVEKVSARYERLIVLVSEGIAHDMETVDITPAAADAVARFQGFVVGLETQVLVFYVAGGEDNLAKWTASLACRYAADPATQSYLLQKESTWELFLRRAGLNVYAAQAILGMLEEAHVMISGRPLRGLAAFVKMSDVERLARFGQVVGGTRVLQRASRVIDRNWDQDARLERTMPKGAVGPDMGSYEGFVA